MEFQKDIFFFKCPECKLQIPIVGYKIEKTQILLDHPITSLGTHDIEIELHKQVKATLKVQVVKEWFYDNSNRCYSFFFFAIFN